MSLLSLPAVLFRGPQGVTPAAPAISPPNGSLVCRPILARRAIRTGRPIGIGRPIRRGLRRRFGIGPRRPRTAIARIRPRRRIWAVRRSSHRRPGLGGRRARMRRRSRAHQRRPGAWRGWTRPDGRRRPVHPVIAASIPRATRVVAPPIIAETEGNDADPQLCAELNDRHAAALIVVIQIVAVDPAAVAFPIDIAPGPAIETTVEIQQRIGRDGRDQGIVRTRAGAQIHCTLGIRIGGPDTRAVRNRGEAGEQQ